MDRRGSPRRKGTVTFMSKQPKKSTIRNWLRRGLSGILSLALILALLPGAVLPAQAAHWAMPYAQKLIDWGVMKGYNGNLALDRPITRAEFVAMMNRAYGYKRLGEMPFPDVHTWDWYYEDINIAYNMGYFQGASGYALPKANLTREMAAVLLARNMMLQENVGEGLQFSDSRTLSQWSRGLVGAAADMGILGGYSNADGSRSFKPKQNITRGEVASMLVKAVGTMVNTKGEHDLGDVYGNVTVNTAGVTLKNGTIAGNLYLTGGIDLGDVTLENINVLGEIIVSGGGESHSSQSSVTLRNVTADAMTVDSITDQFVTLRAEGITDIGTTTVRTNAYVDDSSLPGYGGLRLIIQDGGSLLQLAGNVKEVWNQTPNSELQVVQGSADKITMDERATNSSVLVDGDARVDELNLDVATKVTGEGDIKNLNVDAAGSTVEQLPDDIDIRPGIDADINGSEMNSSQAAESSADPRLLAGYPKVKNIAPNSADLVFSTNKAGTVYWAVSAVSDGSVSEDDLIEPPAYGGKILKSGSVKMTSSNTEVKAAPALTGLTQDGSYYVSTVFVDGRGQHSPVKVTAFTTPDGTTPAFSDGPRMSRITTEVAQVVGMPNKSCQLYYALLPKGATAPTAAELKANAVRGNLGYGTRDVVKNTNVTINVNSRPLDQETDYVVYLWLNDYDGAKSSRVYSVPFKTPDERSPIITSKRPGAAEENAIEMNVAVDEASTVYWVIIPEGRDSEAAYEEREADEAFDAEDRNLQMKIEAGAGKYTKNGRKQIAAANANKEVLIGLNETRPLDSTKTGTSSYVMYMVAKDAAGNYSKIEKVTVRTKDSTPPKLLRQEFVPAAAGGENNPQADASVRLVFSENVRGGTGTEQVFLSLYEAVTDAEKAYDAGKEGATIEAIADARNKLGAALRAHITLYRGSVAGNTENEAPYCASVSVFTPDQGKKYLKNSSTDWVINYCYAQVKMEDGALVVTFPTVKDSTGSIQNAETGTSALRMESGASYHFVLSDITDNSQEANPLEAASRTPTAFTTRFTSVNLTRRSMTPKFMSEAKRKDTTDSTGQVTAEGGTLFTTADDGSTLGKLTIADTSFITEAAAKENPPQRMDAYYRMVSPSQSTAGQDTYWDMFIWANNYMSFTLYSRPIPTTDKPNPAWELEGTGEIRDPSAEAGGYGFVSLKNHIQKAARFSKLGEIQNREYVVHVDELLQRGQYSTDSAGWSAQYNVRISIVAGDSIALETLSNTSFNFQDRYNAATNGGGVTPINDPLLFLHPVEFTDTKPPVIVSTTYVESRDGRGPLIDVTMDNRGRVSYMVIPLDQLTYTENGTTINLSRDYPKTRLTDELLGKVGNNYVTQNGTTVLLPNGTGLPKIRDLTRIGSYSSGTVLDEPGQGLVTNPSLTNESSTGIRVGNTGDAVPAGTASTIDLTGYSQIGANRAYFICMVPQGDAAWSEDVVGFYFVTPEAAKPNLQLDIVDNTDVRATVSRTSTVSQRLLINSGDLGVFKQKFSDLETNKATYGITTAWGNVNDALKTTYGSYTVIQAMREDYLGGSVFDYIASDELKRIVAQDIRTGFGSSTEWLNTGPQRPVTVQGGATGTLFGYNRALMEDNEQYISVAVAASIDGSADAFRAAYYIEKRDTDYPKINSVSAGFQTSGSGDAVKISSGFIQINFHKTLYFRANSRDFYRLAHITGTTLPSGVTAGTGPGQVKYNNYTWQKVDYIGLTNPGNGAELASLTPVAEVSYLRFNITDVPKPSVGNLTSWEVTLPVNLCNWNGANMPNSGITIRVTFNWETGQITKRQIPQNMRGPDYVASDYTID